MSDRESKFPWQDPFLELMLEDERERLGEHAQNVETLIFERLQQPHPSRNGREEHEAIIDALSILRVIKRDKLGFPDWA